MSYSQTIANWELPGITLKFKARTHGGEYACPCPDCGGNDRFIVWPNRGPYGMFWCRRCHKQGNIIDFLKWQKGMSFKEACEEIGKPPKRGRHLVTDNSWWKRPTIISRPQPTLPPPDETIGQKTEGTSAIRGEVQHSPTVSAKIEDEWLDKPKLFSPVCKDCEGFDIDYGIAWCFSDNRYRNQRFLKECPYHRYNGNILC